MTRFLCYSLLALLTSAGTALNCQAEILYGTVGGTYFQNFDGLASSGINSAVLSGRGPHVIQGVLDSTGMEGWYIANPSGSSANTEFRFHDGSLAGNAGRGVVSFGTDGSTERALGALPTGNQISSFGAIFTNSTSVTLTSVTVSYTGEQWRAGGENIQNVLSFRYGFGSSIDDALTDFTALNFNTIKLTGGGREVALDGNAAENQTFIQATISGINWEAGQTMAIRWNANDLTGQDNGLAIDNFSFSAVPEPTSMALIGVVGLGGLVARRLRKKQKSSNESVAA